MALSRSGTLQDEDAFSNGIIIGNFSSVFNFIGKEKYVYSNPEMLALSYQNTYWVVPDTSRYTICSINEAEGQIEGETTIQFVIRDLTSDGKHLWASVAGSKVIEFGQHPSIVRQIHEIPDKEALGIAWNGKTMWIYDKVNNLIFECNNKMQVLNSYRPLFQDEGDAKLWILQDLKYMAFDYLENLWSCDGNMVYKFEKP